jgi:hypothetical protein
MTDRPRLALGILLAAFAAVWAGSFLMAWITPAQGDGFTRGTNRIVLFLGWQALAAALAFGVWLAGQGATGAARIAARVPAILSGLVFGGIAAVLLWVLATA